MKRPTDKPPTTFDLIVEGTSDDPSRVAPRAMHLTGLAWPPPDVVVLDGGTTLIQVGRYLMKAECYSYRVASIARLIDGRLIKMDFIPTESTNAQ